MGFFKLPQHLRFGPEVMNDGALGHAELVGDVADIRSVITTFGDIADKRVENLTTSARRSGHLPTPRRKLTVRTVYHKLHDVNIPGRGCHTSATDSVLPPSRRTRLPFTARCGDGTADYRPTSRFGERAGERDQLPCELRARRPTAKRSSERIKPREVFPTRPESGERSGWSLPGFR